MGCKGSRGSKKMEGHGLKQACEVGFVKEEIGQNE